MVINPIHAPTWLAAIAFVVISNLPGKPTAPVLTAAAPPLGLPPLLVAPASAAATALGKQLFFDRRLSFNGTMACGMCHIEKQAFTSNQLATSVGMEGKSLKRNAPSLYNVAFEAKLFRDGRENALETQVWSPITARDEMAAPSIGWELARIKSNPNYVSMFEEAYPRGGITADTVGSAIAAYERTLLLANSRFDRWRYGGDAGALSPQEQSGFILFTGKAGCAACHIIGEHSALLTDGLFHDTGLGYSKSMGLRNDDFNVRLSAATTTRRSEDDIRSISGPVQNDLGRFEVTLDPKDRWAFKTPSLRNIELTSPYMHDGSLQTLGDVVDYYDAGGYESPNKSELIRPLHLSEAEKADLVAFLKSLTGSNQKD